MDGRACVLPLNQTISLHHQQQGLPRPLQRSRTSGEGVHEKTHKFGPAPRAIINPAAEITIFQVPEFRPRQVREITDKEIAAGTGSD